MTERLDPDDAQQVLRRATELSAQAADPVDAAALDREALLAAAEEAGIGRGAMAQALAEHDAGALASPEAEGRAGVLGRSRVVVTRRIGRHRRATKARVDAWLKAQTLEITERRGQVEVWRPRTDLLAKARRRVPVRRKVQLQTIDAVEVTVVDGPDDSSVVRLEVVFDAMRRGLLTGVVVVPAGITPVLGAVATVLTSEVLFLLGSVPLAAALGAGGIVAGRATLDSERADAARTLELALDDVEG